MEISLKTVTLALLFSLILAPFSAAQEQIDGTLELSQTKEGLKWTNFTLKLEELGPEPVPFFWAYMYAYHPKLMIASSASVGNQWQESFSTRSTDIPPLRCQWIGTTTVELNESVTVPAGTFSNCLLLETKIEKDGEDEECDFVSGTRWMWFALGVGLVKIRYRHEFEKEVQTDIVLVNYSLEEQADKNSYFSLTIGNKWEYDWSNDLRDVVVEEVCMVVKENQIECSAVSSERASAQWLENVRKEQLVKQSNKLIIIWGALKGQDKKGSRK